MHVCRYERIKGELLRNCGCGGVAEDLTRGWVWAWQP